jgi:hypothetical protein
MENHCIFMKKENFVPVNPALPDVPLRCQQLGFPVLSILFTKSMPSRPLKTPVPRIIPAG